MVELPAYRRLDLQAWHYPCNGSPDVRELTEGPPEIALTVPTPDVQNEGLREYQRNRRNTIIPVQAAGKFRSGVFDVNDPTVSNGL